MWCNMPHTQQYNVHSPFIAAAGGSKSLESEVLTAVYMNVAIFWDTAPCSPYMNWRSSATTVHIQTTQCYILEDGNIHSKSFIGNENYNILIKYEGHICLNSEIEGQFWRNARSHMDNMVLYPTWQHLCLAMKFNYSTKAISVMIQKVKPNFGMWTPHYIQEDNIYSKSLFGNEIQ